MASTYPAHIYFVKVNKGNIRAMCEFYSKLTVETPERRRNVVLLVNLKLHAGSLHFCFNT